MTSLISHLRHFWYLLVIVCVPSLACAQSCVRDPITGQWSCSGAMLGCCADDPICEFELLYFSTQEANQSQPQMPAIAERLDAAGYPVRSIDDPDLFKVYRIHVVPQFVMLQDGEEVNRILAFDSQSAATYESVANHFPWWPWVNAQTKQQRGYDSGRVPR